MCEKEDSTPSIRYGEAAVLQMLKIAVKCARSNDFSSVSDDAIASWVAEGARSISEIRGN